MTDLLVECEVQGLVRAAQTPCVHPKDYQGLHWLAKNFMLPLRCLAQRRAEQSDDEVPSIASLRKHISQ